MSRNAVTLKLQVSHHDPHVSMATISGYLSFSDPHTMFIVGGLEHEFYFSLYWESYSHLTNIQRGTPNCPSRGEIPKILKLAWGKAFVEVVAMRRLACV